MLQKCAYSLVVFVAAPLMVADRPGDVAGGDGGLSGAAALFGGYQSARTIHFFAFVALLVFVFVHVAMVIRSGFRRQMRAMTLGE